MYYTKPICDARQLPDQMDTATVARSRYLGTTEEWVRKQVKKGDLVGYMLGREYRVEKVDLFAFIQGLKGIVNTQNRKNS